MVLHARDVQLLNEAKDQLAELQKNLQESRSLEQRAVENLRLSEQSWQEQKRILQRDIEELEQKAVDVAEQNNILLNQLEKISQNRPPPKMAGVEDLESTQEGGMGEVVRYLRREKDILQLQLEAAQQEIKRLKNQVEVMNKSLEDAKLQLQEEREQNKVAEETSRQHEELLRKINELNILRERSASTLPFSLSLYLSSTSETTKMTSSSLNKQFDSS